MDAVKAFNDELSSIYETKPPVSRAKMTVLTKKAIKGIKFYKHIVQSMEKFIQKCRPEYKVPGLYVIDSVVRQSRHQFGQEKDVFMPRLCKNIVTTFKHLYKCPPEEKQRIIRVLNLWQKNSVFPPEIVQQLLEMGGAPSAVAAPPSTAVETSKSVNEQLGTSASEAAGSSKDQPDAGALTNMLAQLLANPNNPQIQQLTGLLSTSQQAQLQALVSQVKSQQGTKEAGPPEPPPPEPTQESSVFLPRQDNSQPPFLQSELEASRTTRPAPSFNRAVLDYDYSDDESPKSQEQSKQHPLTQQHQGKPGIDMELLAKLPTVDQLMQLSGQISNGDDFAQNSGAGFQNQDLDDRKRRLEAEQEAFNKQIQQIPSAVNEDDRSQDDRSSRSTSRRRRSRSKKRSRSRSRSRERRRHRKRSRSRSHERRKRRSRSHEHHRLHHRRSHSSEREKDREREKRGLPPLKEGYISLCSKTLWIGNLASKISQQEINTEVEQYGPIETINMIPPRGCAYICMEKREDAAKALHRLRHTRIGGKVLKVDWAPGKEVKDEYKEFWSKDDGVNYIPLEKVAGRLPALKTQGFVDMESVPEDKRAELESQDSGESEEINHVAAQPGVIAPAGGMMNPQLMPAGVPVMMRPAFPFPGMNPAMGQFGVRQRMPGFQMTPQMPVQSNPVAAAGTVAPAVKTQSPQKQEISAGSKTPTRDEQLLDGAQKAAAVAASIMSSVQPSIQPQQITMAQPRFAGVGQVPVQIRMVPGMPPQQVVPAQRIGMNVMPIRMGMSMQFRPGFTRVPMGQPMVPFQQTQLRMQRMGQMVQPVRQSPVHLPGGPVGLRNPSFQGGMPEAPPNKDGRDVEGVKQIEEPGSEGLGVRQGHKVDDNMRPPMNRPPFGRPPSIEERVMRMGDHPPMGERPPIHPMNIRRPMMEERPPFRFRRSPPGRFGFGGRRHPMDGSDGPRFPGRDRFPDRGMERDDRRRDDFRRRDRSPDRRDRDRRDRGMRDRRFDERDRRGPGFADWGRERGRFGGRGEFGRGRGREGFGDRRYGDRDQGHFDDDPNPEDLEHQRKRDEVLRQRQREGEENYTAEDVDVSAFGPPSGFGTTHDEKGCDGKDDERRDRRNDREDDRKRDRDRDRREDHDRDRDRRDRRRDDRDRSRRDRRRSRSRDRDRDRKENDRRSGEDGDKKNENSGPTTNKKIKLEDESLSNEKQTDNSSEKPMDTSVEQTSSVTGHVKQEFETNKESPGGNPSSEGISETKQQFANEAEEAKHSEPFQAHRSEGSHRDFNEKGIDHLTEPRSSFSGANLKEPEPSVDNSNERVLESIHEEQTQLFGNFSEPAASSSESRSDQGLERRGDDIVHEPNFQLKFEEHEKAHEGAHDLQLNDGSKSSGQDSLCRSMDAVVNPTHTEPSDIEKIEDQAEENVATE